MTVSTTQVRVTYTGDGASVNFPIPFPFYLATDLLVLLAGATITSGYSITGGSGSTGTLTMASAPLAGVSLQVVLNAPLTQIVNLVDGTAFPSATLDQVNDRAVQISQRLQDQINRSLRAPDGDISPGLLLPAAAARASMYLAFDANGNAIPTAALPGTANTQASLGPILNPQTTAEIAAGVTPTNFVYEALDLRRYGQVGSPVPDSAALTSALAVLNGSGVLSLPVNYAGTNPTSLPAGVTIIDFRVAGTFPTGNDLLGGGRWINVGGNPEGSVAGFHTQQWVTAPSTTTSAILGTNKVTGNLSAGGGAMASGTFELDTYGTLTGIAGNIVQALTGQVAIRSLGQTLPLVVGVEGGGGIDRSTATTSITTFVGVQGDALINASTSGAQVTNAYGGRFFQSTASGITNNNFAISSVGDQMFRVGDSIRVENGSGLATIALTFTSNTLLSMPTGVKLALASSIGVNGAAPPAQPTGYGTPTGGALVPSFAAGSMTLPQMAAELAQLIVDLKKYGWIT